jgi:putative oxidoreductase
MDDLGLLLIRLPAGLLLAAHGAQKLFGWFGGGGPEGAGQMFESVGYRNGKTMAMLAGATEVAAGLGIAFGLFTPLAAAGVIGVMANAAVAVHLKAGLWSHKGGYEYPLVLATLAAGLAFQGPGALSLDAAAGIELTGLGWGIGAVALGLVAAVAVLASRRQAPAAAPRE